MTFCPLIRRMRLYIKFLFVRLRFRYPFFSPIPHDINLGSRFKVRRQLRPGGLSPQTDGMPVIHKKPCGSSDLTRSLFSFLFCFLDRQPDLIRELHQFDPGSLQHLLAGNRPFRVCVFVTFVDDAADPALNDRLGAFIAREQ